MMHSQWVGRWEKKKLNFKNADLQPHPSGPMSFPLIMALQFIKSGQIWKIALPMGY